MKKLRIISIIFLLVILGCEQPNFFVGGGQSLDLEAPKLTLLTPANFSFVPSNFSIEGIATDNVGVDEVVIIISKDGEEIKTCKAAISGDKFKCRITDFKSGEYNVVINAYDKARNTSSTSSKSISITVDAGSPNLTLRKPLLFSELSEDILNSKKFHIYSDLDYFKNEDFEISGTVEEDYGVGALTLQLEFAGSNEEGTLFEASENHPIVWNYRIFRKDGEYYYNDKENKDVLAQDIFSGSLNNFCFKIDSSKILIDESPLDYNLRYYFKVRIIAEKKTVPVESLNFYPGYVCIYPKSDEPWIVPSFTEGTSFSVGSSIFGEAYDDDGLSEQGVFYCITAKDKPQPELDDFAEVGSSADSKNVLTWKIDLQKELLPGSYKLWYYAVDTKKENKNLSKSSVSCLEFLVPDPGQPVSEIEMFTGADKTKKASEYPADSSGDFLLAGSAYDTSNVQAVIFAWVPKDTVVPSDWKNTDWSDNIDENWDLRGAFKDGVKYWRLPLGMPKTTSDGRKCYDIALQLNDRNDFKLENGTSEYNSKAFYIFTKGADDANGNKKFTIMNFTVPKDLVPPEIENVWPEDEDNSASGRSLPVNFKIKAIDNENTVDKVYINAAGMIVEKPAEFNSSDNSWKVTVDSSDFSESNIDEVKKFIVTAQDLYGNKKQSIRNIKIKNTSIPISQITSDETVGIVKSKGDVEIYVIADDVITNVDEVNGKPRLKLNVINSNGNEVFAEYKNYSDLGDNKTRLVFVYKISEGDAASPLNVESLELNGGIITNAAGNGINGTIPTSGANSLRSRNIIIDTTLPQIQSITTSVPKGAYGKGSEIDIIIGFDRVLGNLDSGTSTLTLNTQPGGKQIEFDSSKVNVSGNTAVFTYVVSEGENTEKLDVLRFENNGMIADERGNKPTMLDCENLLAEFREIIVDTKAPEIVSYGVNKKSGIAFSTTTYNVAVNTQIEIEFSENIIKNRGSILLERVYKSYPAVMTTEEKASYESIRSFPNWDTYYINRCIGTVGNKGEEPDREGKWVLKYEYEHEAYQTQTCPDAVKTLWNYFADEGVSSSTECLDYNTVRIDINSGLVKVDGKNVTITLAKPLPEGIMFCIKVKGVFTDRANNESDDSGKPICQFETVNAAAPVIRINKLSGLENGSQPKSTHFKISSETYNASYYYGLTWTTNTGAIPQNAPSVTSPYSNAVSIGNNNDSAYVYKIYAKTKNKETEKESGLTKELAFKTVIYNLADGAYGSDSTGGPASTTEFPLAWGSYIGDKSKATNGFLYSWHILKDFQFKLAYGPNAQWEINDPPNTLGCAGKKCNLKDR